MARRLTEREKIARAQTEAGWQRDVEQAAGYEQWYGLHVSDSTRDDDGRLDLLLGHYERGRVIVAELKRETGKTSPGQRIWLDLHARAGQEVYLWYPRHWEEVREILQRKDRPLSGTYSCEWVARDRDAHEADIIKAVEDAAKRKLARRLKKLRDQGVE